MTKLASWRCLGLCASPFLSLPVASWRRAPAGSKKSSTGRSVPGVRQTHCHHQKLYEMIRRRPLPRLQTSQLECQWFKRQACTPEVQWHTWVGDSPPQRSVVCTRQPAPVSGFRCIPVVGSGGEEGGRKQRRSSNVEVRREEVGKGESAVTRLLRSRIPTSEKPKSNF